MIDDLMQEIDRCLNSGIEIRFLRSANPKHREVRLHTFSGKEMLSISKVWDVEVSSQANLSTSALTAYLIQSARLELEKVLSKDRK